MGAAIERRVMARRYKLGKRAESAAETRARIVEAARALFEETGFHQVSVDAVAARAKVGRTTVFEQFGSKRKLLQAVQFLVRIKECIEDPQRLLLEV